MSPCICPDDGHRHLQCPRHGIKALRPHLIVIAEPSTEPIAQPLPAPASEERPTPVRQHIVQSAGYWFEKARDLDGVTKAEVRLLMENAYNHVENALAATERQRDSLLERVAALEAALKGAKRDIQDAAACINHIYGASQHCECQSWSVARSWRDENHAGEIPIAKINAALTAPPTIDSATKGEGMKTVTRTFYVADDGKEFTDKAKCEKYEADGCAELRDLGDMQDCLHLFSESNLAWMLNGDGDCYYATATKYSNISPGYRALRPAWATHLVYFGK